MNIQIEPPKDNFILRLALTKKEAIILISIMGKIAGSITGPRFVADAIHSYLSEHLGINAYDIGSGRIELPDHWDCIPD